MFLDFHKKVQNLYTLCQKQNIDWVNVQQQAKRVIAECVAESHVLAFGQRVEEYQLFIDWSREGLGFCLFADKRLVKVGSKQLPKWYKTCSLFLGGLYAIVWALQQSATMI